jgi:hypothetical protein
MFNSLEIKAAVVAVVALVAFGAGVGVESKIAAGAYAKLELSVSQAHAQALQAAIAEQVRVDAIDRDAADREAATQRTAATVARRNLNEVKKHVQALGKCLPVGVVRVLFAGAHGVAADDLSVAGGKSDATCAADGWVELLQGLVHDQASCRANSTQLDALIANLTANNTTTKKGAPK